MRWAQAATERIAAAIFVRDPCDRTLGALPSAPQGRSRASKAGHLGEFGFQPSVEASGLMIDRFASFVASVPRADVSG